MDSEKTLIVCVALVIAAFIHGCTSTLNKTEERIGLTKCVEQGMEWNSGNCIKSKGDLNEQ